MDYEHNEDQRAILEGVEALLSQYAGPARAIELAAKDEYDHRLDDALREAGFSDVARAEGTGPLEAALVTEAVSRAGGVVAFSAQALVIPGVLGDDREIVGPVALLDASNEGRVSVSVPVPVRYGQHARTLLSLHGDEARIRSLGAGDATPVRSNFGYPMGRIAVDASGGESLGPGSGARLRNWWRVALAVEAVGAMAAALDQTTGYLKQRRQFGKAIASFQAVQHRLASCAIALEGSRWLAYEAAYKGAPEELATTAAAYALNAAGQIFSETHQLSGAIGFTHEHDLHVWSMRLQALRLEQGGVSRHRRAVAAARWGIAT